VPVSGPHDDDSVPEAPAVEDAGEKATTEHAA
jgi:hypothetical protein